MAYYTAKECSVCSGSWLFFRIASNGRTLFLYCPECNSVWLDIAQTSADLAQFPQFETGWLIPKASVGIKGGSARWATSQDIELVGWTKFISGAHDEVEF